jgi:hypothetical protein
MPNASAAVMMMHRPTAFDDHEPDASNEQDNAKNAEHMDHRAILSLVSLT